MTSVFLYEMKVCLMLFVAPELNIYILNLQYGDVLNVIVSSKKKGSAVVEFATVRAAVSTSLFHSHALYFVCLCVCFCLLRILNLTLD